MLRYLHQLISDCVCGQCTLQQVYQFIFVQNSCLLLLESRLIRVRKLTVNQISINNWWSMKPKLRAVVEKAQPSRGSCRVG